MYIGDHSNYSKNSKCAGGPFLDPSNPKTYVYDYNAAVRADGGDIFSKGLGMVWPFGKENWCNLEGRYLHMVADMSQQIASAENSDTVTVCSVGVFGTKYIRNGEPLPDTIGVIQGQSKTISVQRITSSFEIATELAIQLRQSTDLSFVSITEGESTSDVVIDASNQTFGEYTLTLESFNSLSIA